MVSLLKGLSLKWPGRQYKLLNFDVAAATPYHFFHRPCNMCKVVFIKGTPRSALKLGIDPINSHASYFGKSTGSKKRSVPINRTVSSDWNQRVVKQLMIF